MRDPRKECVQLSQDKHGPIAACPVCGSSASVWRFANDGHSSTTAVCCNNGDACGPQNGLVNEGCLLYLPPNGFHQARIKSAVAYWNSYAESLVALRELRDA
jgi:hypothetical protein